MKQIDFVMPCLCSVKGRENVVRTSGTHSAVPSVLLFVFFFYINTTFWRNMWSVTEQTRGNMDSTVDLLDWNFEN